MGQKVNPHGMRVGVIDGWNSIWYADKKSFSENLKEDNTIRTFLKKKLYSAGISRIEIERASDRVKISIYTAKPGILIGKQGAEIEKTKAEVAKLTDKKVVLDIKEVKKPDLDAQLVAENIAQQLENRISYRRAMKGAMGRTMKFGAKGIKTAIAGRLNGAEIARKEFYSDGTIPLQTLRADIDYGFAEADTTYGKIGVKVWINHGEILDKGLKDAIPESTKNDRRDRKSRRNEKRDRKKSFGNRRRDSREARPEVKPATTRVRKAPKVEAPAPEAVTEEVQTESTEA